MNAETKIKPPTGAQKAAPAVYAQIAAVQGALAKHGISKNRTASSGGGGSYAFRGIDDIYNALAPLLAEHGLCVLPRMISRDVAERLSSRGNALFYVTVEAEFDFVAVADGSAHTVRTFGEAMDSGDKATNKAMSAAYKYAAFMAFAIPTEGDNDPDATVHEVAGAVRDKAENGAVSSDGPTYAFPEGPARGITELKALARNLWREIEGTGDDDELSPLLATEENKAIMAQLAKLENPAHREIWEGDGKDNPGIAGLINKKREEFAVAAFVDGKEHA